ncbi:MAG TPA: UvrD-helicase domain-containing protein, partial [Bryobacteraceae bacterium]|nr:UvrD-helicase domain-containing protein [Bryobacteraceae bacterium]
MPDFTPAQNEAIRYRSLDACVVAGPGSGKTTVLVERYRRLIDDHSFEPRQILAITFTEKAAANMKAKLAEKFHHDELRLRELESAWVSTIHGFCARLLRENAIAAGIDPRFSVLDAREADDLQLECLNEALDELVANRREDALALIEALQTPWIAGDLKSAYDGIRSAGRSIEQVRAMPGPIDPVTPAEAAVRLRRILASWPPRIDLRDGQRKQLDTLLEWADNLSAVDGGELEAILPVLGEKRLHLGRVPESAKDALKEFKESLLPAIRATAVEARTSFFRAIVFDILARFDDLYKKRKAAAGTLDFNDLERRAIELLGRNKEVRDRVRDQFRQIMLDEFQDINEQQSELIRLIRSEDVFFAVGDINQSIYGFRHARPKIFRDYRKEIEEARKHSTELLHNFRSRPEILRCVEALLNAAEGIEARELLAAAKFEEKTTPSIEILRSFDEDKEEASNREARWIAHRILALRGEPGSEDFGDFAVLCRNGESMQPVLGEFDRLGIPYVCGRRQSFLLSREGLDTIALLRVVANPRESIALATVLRSTLIGNSDEALLRLRLLGNSLTGGLNRLAYDAASLEGFSDEDAEKIVRFNRNLRRWREDQQIIPLDVLIARALSDCRFDWMPGSIPGQNIEAFLHLARTRGAGRPLLEFLHELESLENAVSAETDLSDEDQGNCVQVMTAHASKGLEFPVTIIAGMEKGTQRSSPSISFTPEHGLGIKWKDPFSDNGLKDTWALSNSDRLKERDDEEAGRLLYVAMTRAEEHLILSYSCGKQRPSNWARRIDELFNLTEQTASANPAILTMDGFQVSALVTDADPPASETQSGGRQRSADVITVSRPAMGDRHETAVNVTSLAVFANCPRKYYLQRYLGWNGSRFVHFDPEDPIDEDLTADLPQTEDPDISAADLGSLVHAALSGKPGEYPAEARILANVFLESDLGRRAQAASRVEREWDFIADMEGILVRGTIDLWFEEDGEIYLVDYKTDMTVRADEYGPQLELYALAIERAFGKRPAGAYLHFLRSNTVVEVPLIHAGTSLITELRDAQDS